MTRAVIQQLSIVLALLLIVHAKVPSFMQHPPAAASGLSTLTRSIPLNHFDPTDNRVFSQRYYINDRYFKPGKDNTAKAILYINGEGPANGPPVADTDASVILAKRNQALIVASEHRYYGDSNPCNTHSCFCNMTVEKLKYLSVDQHMNDLATLINEINKLHPGLSISWVAIGGSYSGATSAWFRMKFPHLVKGAIASSAVVHPIYDFTAWDGQVGISAGEECKTALQQVLATLETKYKQDPAALCAQFHAPALASIAGDFFRAMGDVFGESFQYGYHKDICTAVQVPSDQQFASFVKYTNSHFVPRFGPLDQYATSEQSNTTVRPGAAFNYRLWWWQKATEFGWLQTPFPASPMRAASVNLDYYHMHITKLFNQKIANRIFFPNDILNPIVQNNLRFGGLHNTATKIVYVDASQDPWQHASVSKAPNPDCTYVYISCENCGHCVDLHGLCPGGCYPNANVVEEARAKIFAALESYWNE